MSKEVRTNSKGDVIVPFFRVGVPAFDLQALMDAVKRR